MGKIKVLHRWLGEYPREHQPQTATGANVGTSGDSETVLWHRDNPAGQRVGE